MQRGGFTVYIIADMEGLAAAVRNMTEMRPVERGGSPQHERFRQELTDRFGPMPQPVVRLVEVAELRLAAEAAGVASMSREEGQLVVRFGEGLTRATAMRLLAGPPLPGLRPNDVTFASNQVRLRLPADPRKGWTLTQAVVGRLSVAAA